MFIGSMWFMDDLMSWILRVDYGRGVLCVSLECLLPSSHSNDSMVALGRMGICTIIFHFKGLCRVGSCLYCSEFDYII